MIKKRHIFTVFVIVIFSIALLSSCGEEESSTSSEKLTKGKSEFTLDNTITVKEPKGWTVDEFYWPGMQTGQAMVGFSKEETDENITVVLSKGEYGEAETYEKIKSAENAKSIETNVGEFWYEELAATSENSQTIIGFCPVGERYVQVQYWGDDVEEGFPDEVFDEYVSLVKSIDLVK